MGRIVDESGALIDEYDEANLPTDPVQDKATADYDPVSVGLQIANGLDTDLKNRGIEVPRVSVMQLAQQTARELNAVLARRSARPADPAEVEKARREEREACAKIADDFARPIIPDHEAGYVTQLAGEAIAAAIRVRSSPATEPQGEACRKCGRRVEVPCHDAEGYHMGGPWDFSCADYFNGNIPTEPQGGK